MTKGKRIRSGRPCSSKYVYIMELDETVQGYAEAARRIGGNRGCVYLCCNNPQGRKKHKGYTFILSQK